MSKMHAYNCKATRAAITFLALLCACLLSIDGSAAQRTKDTSSRVDHAGLIVAFSLSCSGHTVQLDATITNQTHNSVVIESGTLPWEYDILGSEFVAEASGRKLKRNWTTPLIGRVGPITLTSHERRSGTVPISTLFPRLGAALKTGAVVVRWKYRTDAREGRDGSRIFRGSLVIPQGSCNAEPIVSPVPPAQSPL